MSKLLEDCFALALLLLSQSALVNAFLEGLASETASAAVNAGVAVFLVVNFLAVVAQLHILFEGAGRR